MDGAGAKLTGLTTAGYLTDGQQTMFAYANTNFAQGVQWRLLPQGYYYWGPISFLGEYMVDSTHINNGATRNPKTADLKNTAWEIQGGYILTGETASYNNGVTPSHPFNPLEGRWGAVQTRGAIRGPEPGQQNFPHICRSDQIRLGRARLGAGPELVPQPGGAPQRQLRVHDFRWRQRKNVRHRRGQAPRRSVLHPLAVRVLSRQRFTTASGAMN